MPSMLIRFLDCFDEQKIYLALWRVLVYDDKRRRFAPPDKHTPLQNQAERKVRAKRGFALTRVRNSCFFVFYFAQEKIPNQTLSV